MTGRLSAAAISFAVAGLVRATPTPTPTPPAPAPKLSGGFGRAASTPVPRPQSGQSLQDVVRAASETRQGKETPKPGVAITNQTLVTDPNRGRLTTWQGSAHPAGATPAAGARNPAAAHAPAPTATAPPASAAEAGAESTEETKWREAARLARERVANGRERVTQLDAETHKLENDFYSWDDGQYRDRVIKPSWDHAREQLDEAKTELAGAEKDLADLPERARKAGALPGWIRE